MSRRSAGSGNTRERCGHGSNSPVHSHGTFVVLNLNNSGAGSLRQAIIDAQAAGTDSVVTFAGGLSGTITLTSGQMKILKSLRILGPGPDVIAISGNADSRALYLRTAGPTDEVTISGVKLTNCKAHGGGDLDTGGALVNWSGVLTLDDLKAVDSVATVKGGALRLDAETELSRCTITGNTSTGYGGGIYAGGSDITIDRSTIADNECTAGLGGGISVNNGSLDIRKSTVSSNEAGTGGGLQLYGSALVMENATVSGNAADYGAGAEIDTPTSASISLSTISGNVAEEDGGGIRLYGGTVDMSNSILAANSAATDPDINTLSGTLNSNYSLIKQPGAATITGAHNTTGTDPSLGPLADNGGPTQTRKPQPGSAAIDTGDPAFSGTPSTDQRGQSRVSGGRVDKGSVET